MGTVPKDQIGFTVSDVSGQKQLRVTDPQDNATVGELVEGAVTQMRLPRNDAGGRPLNYHARLDREGRHLHGSESLIDALESGDHLTLQPDIDAGGSSPSPGSASSAS